MRLGARRARVAWEVTHGTPATVHVVLLDASGTQTGTFDVEMAHQERFSIAWNARGLGVATLVAGNVTIALVDPTGHRIGTDAVIVGDDGAIAGATIAADATTVTPMTLGGKGGPPQIVAVGADAIVGSAQGSTPSTTNVYVEGGPFAFTTSGSAFSIAVVPTGLAVAVSSSVWFVTAGSGTAREQKVPDVSYPSIAAAGDALAATWIDTAKNVEFAFICP